GRDSWVGALQNGLTDEQLEAAFIGSAEYIQNHGGAGAGWIRGMYIDLLGRTPVQSEVDFWVAALQAGQREVAIAYGFAACDEREGIRVRADYGRYLGRQAIQPEVDFWVRVFHAGVKTNEGLVAEFVGSVEYFQGHFNNIADW